MYVKMTNLHLFYYFSNLQTLICKDCFKMHVEITLSTCLNALLNTIALFDWYHSSINSKHIYVKQDINVYEGLRKLIKSVVRIIFIIIWFIESIFRPLYLFKSTFCYISFVQSTLSLNRSMALKVSKAILFTKFALLFFKLFIQSSQKY